MPPQFFFLFFLYLLFYLNWIHIFYIKNSGCLDAFLPEFHGSFSIKFFSNSIRVCIYNIIYFNFFLSFVIKQSGLISLLATLTPNFHSWFFSLLFLFHSLKLTAPLWFLISDFLIGYSHRQTEQTKNQRCIPITCFLKSLFACLQFWSHRNL